MGVGERLANFLKKTPRIGDSVFIAPSASVIGDVTLEDNVSIWYHAVLRGDINSIRIGYGTNLQDGVIGHLSDDYPLIVGEYVTVGHGAVLHACEIEDECLIGMNSTILDGSRIGKHSIVAAGTVVPLGVNIPEGSLVAGVPGKVKRQLSGDERLKLKGWAEKYFSVKDEHQKLSVSENSSI
jgi:carbonic anhydrase/acetyltransferase-like protein (isoleucine patch superfamily)